MAIIGDQCHIASILADLPGLRRASRCTAMPVAIGAMPMGPHGLMPGRRGIDTNPFTILTTLLGDKGLT
ncbi:hypothetical protein BI347_14795 [Chromobacterium sphagni]|uniref:Uncharacterized protein n=1 Tax=Chromobacterium sphagni TaxID=1903179 RepID=A0A1S1X573_9NEIS|nr:hypothetical protein BI347_14795 [Chromobacterium sphagni]